MDEPTASEEDTRASRPGGMYLASATVHWIIMASTASPAPNAHAQTRGSGHNMASASVGAAIVKPIPATNSIRRPGEKRSDNRPPAIRPTDAQAVIAPPA